MTFLSEDACPIEDGLLGRLYRSSPDGVAELARTVPARTRATLAFYCSRRAHLDSSGLTIAATCTPEDLYDIAGKAGLDLFARSQAEVSKSPEPSRIKSRRGISLSSGALWRVPTDQD